MVQHPQNIPSLAMGKEEAAYWLRMAMQRKSPRRVLMALRCLLTDPNR
ncbi:MAG: hypothetical protein RLZZ184_2349 [Cyanobacteriota bacterium]|jgi:hypothetical protein